MNSDYDSQDQGINQDGALEQASYGNEDESASQESVDNTINVNGPSTHDFAWLSFWVFGGVQGLTAYYILDRMYGVTNILMTKRRETYAMVANFLARSAVFKVLLGETSV